MNENFYFSITFKKKKKKTLIIILEIIRNEKRDKFNSLRIYIYHTFVLFLSFLDRYSKLTFLFIFAIFSKSFSFHLYFLFQFFYHYLFIFIPLIISFSYFPFVITCSTFCWYLPSLTSYYYFFISFSPSHYNSYPLTIFL